jgi:hypothetical protein
MAQRQVKQVLTRSHEDTKEMTSPERPGRFRGFVALCENPYAFGRLRPNPILRLRRVSDRIVHVFRRDLAIRA